MQEMQKVIRKAHEWLSPIYDQETHLAIKKLLKKEKELINAFYKELAFGTGGVREKMGVGTNRINLYTLKIISQGVVHYLKKKIPRKKLKIAIAYDTRNNSAFFAREVAALFSKNNIVVYCFTKAKPTPLLSFTIRELGCHLGVVITASHNPKEYNGYKIYNQDGGQIVEPTDKEIIQEIQKIGSYAQVVKILQKKKTSQKIKSVPQKIEKRYYQKLKPYCPNLEVLKGKSLTYSPLHGNGINLLPDLLYFMGVKKVNLVKEQAKEDGNFPTVKSPNPEEQSALKLGIATLKKNQDDLLLATDPDSDRLAVVIREKQSCFIPNGNQIGVLLLHYLIEQKKKLKEKLQQYYVVTTIVSTPLILKIAEKNKLKCATTLTGFKYIGEMIKKTTQKKFLFAMEESYGYLITDKVRDKDAVSSALTFSEMFYYYQKKGITIQEVLKDIYCRYGHYLEELFTLKKEGKSGIDFIQKFMNKLREKYPKKINGEKVLVIKDYLKKIVIQNQVARKLTRYPQTNLVQFFLSDNTLISIRPSGTEPKIKFYISVNQKVNLEDFTNSTKALQKKLKSYRELLSTWL